MISKTHLSIIAVLLPAVLLAGCSKNLMPVETPTPTLTAATNTAVPPTPTVTPTPTEVPFFVDATVWTGEINAPILIYHYFGRDNEEDIPTTWTRFKDFENHLQQLYDNGFSLVPLSSWIDGSFIVPEGRKPLVLTIDDFWRSDQIYVDDDGTPSLYSGIGILWRFSQEHPDFGFAASGFSNMGDKFFSDTLLPTEQRYIRVSADNSPIWRDKLSTAMVWALENGVTPYNHLFTHPKLDITMPQDIQYQLAENDRVTRFYLTRVGREDLIPTLGNIIALPFGIWPATPSGVQVLKNYKNPEGLPVAAIMEAYNLDAAKLTPSVFSENYDRFKINRITASDSMIQFIIDQKDEIPSALICQVGPIEEEMATDPLALRDAIAATIAARECPEGVYNINDVIFDGRGGIVEIFQP